MKTAQYWHVGEDGCVQCDLCPHRCTVAEGKTGRCRIRMAEGDELKAMTYGCVSSAGLDPIEKKPLYHFCPGTAIFSVGGWGCSFACAFCQNWTISQKVDVGYASCSPEQLVGKAHMGGSIGMAYTYNEPLVGYEFVRDCALAARAGGLANVLVTNGYINREPAAGLLPLIDALNIDIKSMDDAFYRRQCRASLDPVLAFAVQAVEAGCHVEITNLVIPGLNDTESGLAELAGWIRKSLGQTVPLHLSAYRPEHKLRVPATPTELLERAYEICRQELAYVYLGNVVSEKGRETHCPQCETLQVERMGYATRIRGLKDGVCTGCGRKADIIPFLPRRVHPAARRPHRAL